MLRIVLILLALSLAATAAAAWLVPVDGARFRADIERAASLRLGIAVHLEGPITLRLLPTPTLEAGALSLSLADGTVTADSLRLAVALQPLLTGAIVPHELTLRHPEIRLAWPLPAAIGVPTPDFAVRVEDGTLVLGRLAISDIDATVAADPQTGDTTLSGRMSLGGRAWRGRATLGNRGADGVAALRVAVEGQAHDLGATLSGQLASDGTLSGHLIAHGADLADLLPAPAVAFTAEGRASVGDGLISADDLTAEVAGAPVRGAIALRVSPQPRLDVALTTARLDLDSWLALLHRDAVGAAPLIGDLPIGLDVSADSATLAGGTLHALRATFDVDHSGATVSAAEMVLPGESAMHFTGKVSRDPTAALRFDGDARLSAPVFSQTVDWLAQAGWLPVGAVPAGVLQTLDVAANVGLDTHGLRLGQISGDVDGSRVDGTVAITAAGGRPALLAALTLGRLNLDRWLPATWPSEVAWPLDLELQVGAKAASLRGVALEDLRVDAGDAAGEVTLRRFRAGVEGGTVNASGSLSGDGRLSAAQLSLDLPRAGAFDRLFPAPVPSGLRELPVTLQLSASGRPEALSTEIDATLGGLDVTASPRLDLRGVAWNGPIRLRAPSARAWLASAGLGDLPWIGEGSLGVTADLTADPAQAGVANLDATAGGLRTGGELHLDFSGAEPALTGRLAAERLPLPGPPARRDEPLPLTALAGWHAALRVEAAELRPLAGPTLTQASGELTLAAGRLRLADLTAQLAGGTLSGMADLATAERPPHLTAAFGLRGASLDGGLTGMPVDLIAGGLDASASLDAAGHSVATFLATLRGSLSLDVKDGVLRGVSGAGLPPDLPASRVAQALSGGRTAGLNGDIKAGIGDGAVTITDARLLGEGFAIGLDGSVDLAAATTNLLWSIHPDLPGAPELDLRLAGPLAAPTRAPELANLARWRVRQAAP